MSQVSDRTERARAALRARESTDCPACAATKSIGHAVCRDCFGRLPRSLQIALYKRVRQGFEDALARAVDVLKRRQAGEVGR